MKRDNVPTVVFAESCGYETWEGAARSQADVEGLGRSAFLLDPGGPDYVGKNSYDGTSRVDE